MSLNLGLTEILFFMQGEEKLSNSFSEKPSVATIRSCFPASTRFPDSSLFILIIHSLAFDLAHAFLNLDREKRNVWSGLWSPGAPRTPPRPSLGGQLIPWAVGLQGVYHTIVWILDTVAV